MFSGKVEDAAGEATERGASGFIGKPFDPQQLIDRRSRSWARARSDRARRRASHRWVVSHREGRLDPFFVGLSLRGHARARLAGDRGGARDRSGGGRSLALVAVTVSDDEPAHLDREEIVERDRPPTIVLDPKPLMERADDVVVPVRAHLDGLRGASVISPLRAAG